MPSTIPSNLHAAFAAKTLIPIVGAGVSMSLLNKSGDRLFPSWAGLLELAAARLTREGNANLAAAVTATVAIGDYQQAADYARKGLTGSLWNQFFKENFSVNYADIDDASLALPRAVWTLGQRVITLNYDRVMRFACPRPHDVLELDNTNKGELADLKRNASGPPVVWHLHGKIDNLEKIIFTSDRYSKLYLATDQDYQAALETFRAMCGTSQLLFIGCGLDDAELLQQLAREHNIFAGNTSPHYALVRQADHALIQAKLKGLLVELLAFADFGQPLLDTIAAIASGPATPTTPATPATPAMPSTPATPPKATPAATPGGKRIAILSANPIGENYRFDATHAAVLQEFNAFKCHISHFPLTTKALEALDGFHYIVILSFLIKGKLVIEDDALQNARIGFKALEERIGNGPTDGVFIFLNHIDKTPLAADPIADEIASLALPTLILGVLEKPQVNSLHFQLFKRANLDYFANGVIANRGQFKLGEIKGVNKVDKNATPLPDAIDPKTTRHHIGRNTDLQNICRKIIDLRGRNEVLIIKGPGGIGKTATIKKIAVALAARKRFADGIDFIDCEFIPDYPAFVKKLATNFDLEKALDIKQHIKDVLDKQDKLIILDNLETLLYLADRQSILQFIEFISDYASIVVTTRELPGLGCEQVYELSRFSTDEAYALFIQHCGCTPADDATRRLIRAQIVETLLDNNPLAITLVAKNIPKGKDFTDLQRELEHDIFHKASAAELADLDSVADGNIERKQSLYASINFSYRHLNEAEQMALEILSLFPDGIDIQALKQIADRHRAALRKGAPAPAKPPGPIIGDLVIKALENKSMTQVDHHTIKLQSIVGKFAEYQLQQRDPDQGQRHYRNAIAYNIDFAQALNDLLDEDAYRAAKTFNAHQANFFKSIDYLDAAPRDAEDLLDYLLNLCVLASATTASGAFARALENKTQMFSADARARRCFALIVLSAEYYAGDFDAAFARLKQIMPLASVAAPDPGSGADRIAMGIATAIYGMEGEALLALKWDIQTNRDYRGGYPGTLLHIGVIDLALLSHCKTDFFTLEAKYASGALDNAMLDAYIVYEKDHLERMQANYVKAKLNSAVRQSADAIRREQARISKLVIVNQYTKGLQQLMLAFCTVDVDAKIALFDDALVNLRHIHYYYVEALLLFARALRACGRQPRYAAIHQEGVDLACRHHYRWLRHQFADVDQGRTTPYRAEDYPLPEELAIDGYVQRLIKWHKS